MGRGEREKGFVCLLMLIEDLEQLIKVSLKLIPHAQVGLLTQLVTAQLDILIKTLILVKLCDFLHSMNSCMHNLVGLAISPLQDGTLIFINEPFSISLITYISNISIGSC